MSKPIFLKGAVKDYIWGGNKLRELFGKESDREIIAESWELSCHMDGCSVVMNSEDKGLTLTEYINKYGVKAVLGRDCPTIDDLPLIKLIDAKQPLSVQVHPDDHYAHEKGFPKGKTEMWYVLDAEPEAKLVYGVNQEITREELQYHIENGTLEDILNFVHVKKGDVFFIPAGIIHAIGKGILIAEVQQNSNLTYRVYDYNRRDADGNLRELHIEDAVAAATLEPSSWENPFPEWHFPWGKLHCLSYCKFFTSNRLELEGERRFETTGRSFIHLLIIEGQGTLTTDAGDHHIKKGDSILLRADTGNCRITGNICYVETYMPSAEE